MTSTTNDAPARPGGAGLLALLRRLTSRDHFILRTLADHQVLTTSQVADLAFTSLRAAQQRLTTLAQLGAVGRFRRNLPAGSEPWRYYLAPAGAALIAAERGQPAPPARKVTARALALASSQRLDHLLGVNGFFTSLAAAARASSGSYALADWWSEQRCTAEYGEIVRPDGYGAWASGGNVTGFFLEYDNSTETTARAAGKLAQYADLATAEADGVLVLFWLTSPAREAALRPALERAQAGAVTIATATPAHGQPAGQVWLPLRASHRTSLASLSPATSWEGR